MNTAINAVKALKVGDSTEIGAYTVEKHGRTNFAVFVTTGRTLVKAGIATAYEAAMLAYNATSYTVRETTATNDPADRGTLLAYAATFREAQAKAAVYAAAGRTVSVCRAA